MTLPGSGKLPTGQTATPDGAPYDPQTLHPPLTAAQRQAILAWGAGEIAKHPTAGYPSPPTTADDQHVIAWYTVIVLSVGGVKIAGGPGISSITDFLKLLVDPHLWLRVGEFVLGLLLMGVGLAHLAPGNDASSAISRIPVVGKVVQ